MKLRWLAVLAVGLATVQASAQETPSPKTQQDKISYAIGAQIALSLKNQGIDANPAMVAQAFKDVFAGGKLLMSEDDLRATLSGLQQEMKQKQSEAMAKAADENRKAGEAFLVENGKKEGVTTLPSGLQYKVIIAGQGKKPTDADTVLCAYRGMFTDGREFDASPSGQPAAIGVGGVIPGFKEALKLMPVGSKWQIVVPSQLAYGQVVAGDTIGPNATLVFEVELISIQDKP